MQPVRIGQEIFGIDLALFVYMKRLPGNCRRDVSALAEHGRLCTPVHNRVHRQRTLFTHVGKTPLRW
jgi:hypothetical protein